MQTNHKNLEKVLTFSSKQVHSLHCPEATISTAVRCTGQVESIIVSLMESALTEKSQQQRRGSSTTTNTTQTPTRRRRKPSELSSRDLQLGIHTNEDLCMMCDSIPSLSAIVTAYLDHETEQLFQEAGRVLPKPPSSTSSRAGDGDTLPVLSQWRRQDDAAVTDSDFSRLLTRTHPAYTLSNDARLFLGSMTRELIVETLKGKREPSSASLLVGGSVGQRASRYGKVALDRFSMVSPSGKQVKLVFRALDSTTTTATCKMRANRNEPLSDVLDKVCGKLKMKRKTTTFVYFGKPLDTSASPERIGMDSTARPVRVFAVPKKWWIFKQREQARKGLLTSLKSIDVKELVGAVQSKVDQRNETKQSTKQSIKRHRSSARAGSTTLLAAKISASYPQPTPANDEDPRFMTRLKKPKNYQKESKDTNSSSMPRLVRTPRNGARTDLSELDNIPVPQIEAFTDPSQRSLLRKNPFRPVRHRRTRKVSAPGDKLRSEKRKELRRKGEAEAAQAKLRREKKRNKKKQQAVIKIQSKMRQVRDRRRVQDLMRQHRESQEMLKKERIAMFREAGKHTFKESKRTMKAWDRVRRVLQDLPRWIEHLEVPSDSGEDGDGEARLCLEHAKRLRTMLFDAETQSETFQETARSTLSMLEKWDQLAVSDDKEVEREEQETRRPPVQAASANTLQEVDVSGGFVESKRVAAAVHVGVVGEIKEVTVVKEESVADEPQEEEEEEEEEEEAPRLPVVARTYPQRRMKKPLATVEEEE